MSNTDLDRLFALAAQLKAVQEEMEALLKRGGIEPPIREKTLQVKVKSPEQAVSSSLIKSLRPEGHDQQVGEMLRDFRDSLGLNVAEIARRIKRGHRSEVYSIEKGENSPTVRTLVKHAEALGGEILVGIQPKSAADGPN